MLATYYRNNVLHLFALPSLIACCFLGNAQCCTGDIQRLGGAHLSLHRAELFLRWEEAELPRRHRGGAGGAGRPGPARGAPRRGRLVTRRRPTSAAAMQLSLLAQSTIQTIERYYLASRCWCAPAAARSPGTLEERCQLMAQRMTLLYGFNSPEFFDRTLFENFIDLLRERGVVRTARAASWSSTRS